MAIRGGVPGRGPHLYHHGGGTSLPLNLGSWAGTMLIVLVVALIGIVGYLRFGRRR